MSNDSKDQLKHRTYRFSIALIKYVTTLPKDRIYAIIIDQLVRSATSIGANIIEAQAASSKKDFTNYFSISLKSANETLYWLGILRDGTEADKDTVNKFIDEVKEICKILGASILTLKNKR